MYFYLKNKLFIFNSNNDINSFLVNLYFSHYRKGNIYESHKLKKKAKKLI